MAEEAEATGGHRDRGSRDCSCGCGREEKEVPWRWLESTEVLQREAYGFDWSRQGRDVALVAASLKENLIAAAVELLGEVPREFAWKYWARDEPFVNRDRVLAELVDVGHFVANMLVTLGVTDDEWEAAYQAKQEENRRRQRDGYSARKG